MDNEI